MRISSHVGRSASPWLNRWLGEQADEFRAIESALPVGTRLVVLIDDVDRADPKVLPSLLFALHDALSVGKLSYVLALAPNVVTKALIDYHRGFGEGPDFLEKIIQFPRWLPDPTDDDLAALAEGEIKRYASFVPVQPFRDEFRILPKNPRALRTLARSFWTLRDEVGRHEPDEIDWNLLVVLASIRAHGEGLFRGLLASPRLLKVVYENIDDQSNEELLAELNTLIEKKAPRDPEGALKAIKALSGRSLRWTADHIRYHAYLSERPHAVTWKEFYDLVGQLGASSNSVSTWVSTHAQTRGTTEARVEHDLIDTAARFHHQKMEKATDEDFAEQAVAQLEGAEIATRLLSEILLRATREKGQVGQ